MDSLQTYLNFPIIFLQEAFRDIKKVMNDIMAYAGYVHTLKLEYGEDEDLMKAAGHYFGITYGNAYDRYRHGETLFNSIDERTPMAGINKDVLFDFYKNRKTFDEIAVLLAFLAIKSIIGKKPYIKLTNDFLIARMAGCSSISDIPVPLPEPLFSYQSRRKLDTIKFKLQTEWNVNYYSYYTRGFYVSIDNKFPLDRLVLEAEKRKKISKQKQLKQKKEDARKQALRKLRNNYESD